MCSKEVAPMSEYVGITIGPVFETLQLAETPAALWYASACFSELTRVLLQQLTLTLPDVKIIAPYYDGTKYTDGVGRYHDRILLETASSEKLPEAVAAAKAAIVDMVVSDIDPTQENADDYRAYLEHYFQIHYIAIPAQQCKQNILSEFTPLLDAIERMPRCNSSRGTNPFRALFSAKGEDTLSRNARIKASAMLRDVTDSQLLVKDGQLRSIESICCTDKRFKRSNYFAIVAADGDGMSKFFSSMDNAAVSQISEDCFAFAEAAATEIKNFGGMTVYVGGDDLLFLAPVQSVDGETIFEFCNRLSALFSQKVAKNQPAPSASFGIAIRYMRFPLYEALNAAYAALSVAKQCRPEKNAFALDVQKHSGQSMQLCIAKEGYPLFDRIITQMLKQESQSANSLIYILDKFASSIYVEAEDQRTKNINIFLNNYDSEAQKTYVDHIRTMAELFCDFQECGGLISSQVTDGYAQLKCFEQMLRIGKFFAERGSVYE